MADEQPGDVLARQVPIVWIEPDEPIIFANQFLIQYFEEEFILSFGQLVPPPMLANEDEDLRRERLERLEYVPSKVVGRFGFTPQRMRNLVRVMQDSLARYEERQGQEDGDE